MSSLVSKVWDEVRSHPVPGWLTAVAILLAIAPGIYSVARYQKLGPYLPEVAVLTATLIAIIWYTAYTYEGLGEWRDQLITRASFKAATSLRVASDKALSDLQALQQPVVPPREDPTEPQHLVDPESEWLEVIVTEYEARLRHLRDSIDEVEEATVEARAIWRGQLPPDDAIENLREAFQRLQDNLNYHVTSLRMPDFRAGQQGEVDRGWVEAASALWGRGDDGPGPEITEELNQLRQAADDHLAI